MESQKDDLISIIPMGVLQLDAHYTILGANDAAEEMLGRSRQALLGRDCLALFPALSGIVQSFWRDPSKIIKDDTYIEGKHYRIDMVFHETALLILTPETNHPSSADSNIPSMTDILRHELKNPLAGIRGAAQLLSGRLSENDRLLTELIIKESDRMVALIESFGALGSEEDLAIININEVLDHAASVARHGFASHLSLNVHFDPSLPEIKGKRDQLTQAILNLLKNAAEAGDRVILRSLYTWGPLLSSPNGARQRLGLAIEVEDNGPGIPQNLEGRIFEPFVSTKRGGRGLGLVQVLKTVQDHLGMIEYKTHPTIFRMTLPISLPEKN